MKIIILKGREKKTKKRGVNGSHSKGKLHKFQIL
jgi:hypothetical protein